MSGEFFYINGGRKYPIKIPLGKKGKNKPLAVVYTGYRG